MNNLEKSNRTTDLHEILKPYIRNWYWFSISLFAAICLAIYTIKSTAPVYHGQSSILIKDAKKMSSNMGEFGLLQSLGGFSGMSTNSIENEIEVFKSKKIIEDVLKRFDFQVNVYSKQKYYNLELYGETNPYLIKVIQEFPQDKPQNSTIFIERNGEKFTLKSDEWEKPLHGSFGKTIRLPFADLIFIKNPKFNPSKVKNIMMDNLFIQYTDFETLVFDYQENFEVDLLDKNATVIGLSIDYPNKNKAKDFLNGVVDEYNEYAIKDKNIESKKTKDFIDERITLIGKELGDVESEKERFKTRNNIVDVAIEGKLDLQTKSEAKQKEVELETQLQLSKIFQQFLNNKGLKDVLPTNIGLDNETVAKGVSEYNILVIKRSQLLQNATEDNPAVKIIEEQLSNLKKSIKESLEKGQTSIEIAKNNISSEKADVSRRLDNIPSFERMFRSIERQQQIKESLYLLLLEKREEAAISMAISAPKARVLDTAYISKKPVSPKKIIILSIFSLLGLGIPFLIIHIRNLLYKKIVTRRDVQSLSSTSIIAEIPKIKDKSSQLIRLNDVTPLAEAFRILTTNLRFILPKKNSAKIIMVTSSTKGEGKTFISVNVGLALANSKDKVLIIGSDIRNPQLQRYNEESKNYKGLTEFLYGDTDNIEDIIKPSGINNNCDFIYSGVIPPNPVELLNNGKYEDLLEQLKPLYSYIILDTAPLLPVTDSFLISPLVDATVYVIRSEVSEKSYIEFANEVIESKKIKNVVFVINSIETKNFGYGNTQGYGYHADKKSSWFRFLKR